MVSIETMLAGTLVVRTGDVKALATVSARSFKARIKIATKLSVIAIITNALIFRGRDVLAGATVFTVYLTARVIELTLLAIITVCTMTIQVAAGIELHVSIVEAVLTAL